MDLWIFTEDSIFVENIIYKTSIAEEYGLMLMSFEAPLKLDSDPKVYTKYRL